MGAVAGGAAGPFGAIAGDIGAGNGSNYTKNPLTRALGLSGEQGEYYVPSGAPNFKDTPQSVLDYRSQMQMANNPALANILSQYGQGGLDLQSALAQAKDMAGNNYGEAMNQFAINPLTGSKMATEQVQTNPILSQLFGKGGVMDRTNTEEQQLAGRGYSLQPEDYEAYGQASGDISRMFGQQGNSLAQSLANRGLSQGGSGAALAQYAGLQGNKFEQLAGMQRDIADKRMQTNMARLQGTRQFLSQLGNQAGSEIQNQYQRNLGGVQEGRQKQETGMQADLTDAANWNSAQNTYYGNKQAADYNSATNKQENAGHTLLGALGSGLYGGVQSGSAKASGKAAGGM